jgi:hypothetical protein
MRRNFKRRDFAINLYAYLSDLYSSRYFKKTLSKVELKVLDKDKLPLKHYQDLYAFLEPKRSEIGFFFDFKENLGDAISRVWNDSAIFKNVSINGEDDEKLTRLQLIHFEMLLSILAVLKVDEEMTVMAVRNLLRKTRVTKTGKGSPQWHKEEKDYFYTFLQNFMTYELTPLQRETLMSYDMKTVFGQGSHVAKQKVLEKMRDFMVDELSFEDELWLDEYATQLDPLFMSSEFNG